MSTILPDRVFNRITDIKSEDLAQDNVSGLLVDVDNTLSTHGGQTPLEGLTDWLEYIKQSGITVIILSNAKKKRVMPFAEKLGLKFISLSFKPTCFGFIKGMKVLGLKRKNIAIVGDQLFTDVLGGNIFGVKTYLVRPILLEDKISFKIKRKLENHILSKHKLI
ncbi:MAG: YqeG family HAD IIIA-type phosphatase [Oscillospiraceae bacterium]|nr:YqeG family HAD IIIA-type phosphatase [Oscillospiraceae bacterium]